MNQLPLSDLIAQVGVRIEALRTRLRASAANILAELPEPTSTYTGVTYVESAGAVLQIERGGFEGVYTPDAVRMRDASLAAMSAERPPLFRGIANQFLPGSRVLNVGAGGDVVPIRAIRDAGHEVISTDLLEETVRLLRSRTDTPVFACELVHLKSVLNEQVDYVVGNSTLAYVEPSKLSAAVSNSWESMRRGAVFTFDLAPHPTYFDLAESITARNVTNASESDPRKLLDFVKRFGVQDGINAMAWHTYYRALAVNLSVVSLLRDRFLALGATCKTGLFSLRQAQGGRQQVVTLRVARQADEVLEPLPGEVFFEDSTRALKADAQDGKPFFALVSIDRAIGERLAREFGIHEDLRSDPWNVAAFVHEQQNSASLAPEIRQLVLAELDPQQFAARIRPYTEGKEVVPATPPPDILVLDQTIHKLVFTGAIADQELADRQIDAAYAKAALQNDRAEANSALRAAKATRKKERKKKDKARRQQRRK